MNYLNRHPMMAVFFFLGCIFLSISAPNIKSNISTMGEIQQVVRKNSTQEWKLRASQQAAQAQAEIAEQRYRDGCVMVVAMNNPDSFTSLSEGEPVIDHVRNVPLPIGTVVCDANGNTAVIIKGENQPVTGEIAFTGNQELIANVRQKFNKNYALPNLK
ncbi:hypothetical protein PN456_09375 [Nodularia spumigena CS-586/05]|uniref:hypothetical protein n=1 Tax=Nodularia spumigena TaxID=70799 RepID=UPI0023306638|nr:hypothetical protein [Nodularia spumigena]MDB9369167.1 hypothetical protein [Nodularia spumigena CS-586/05]